MTIHTIHRLNDRTIKATTEPGRYNDGGGLYFVVTDRGGRSWEYRYDLSGRRRYMGLGGYPEIALGKARELHKAATAQVRAGIDPIDARKAGKQIAAASLTVTESIEAYIAAMEVDWKTRRYPDQIRERMNTYVKPIIGDMAISDIGPTEARLVLAPIWNTIRPTAKRIRQHLEGIVDGAIAGGHRKNEINPFEIKRLKGSLSFAKQKTRHFASLPFEQAPAFMTELGAQPDSVKKFALMFVVLNAVRVADICGGGKQHSEPMKWSHVDLAEKTWRVPDTKTGAELIVPLSDAAMAVLAQMQRHRDSVTDIVFPGAVRGTVISDATLRYLIADMGYKGTATTHGFRATFKTWAEEVGGFDTLVVEAALAHAK
jgi:integrase